MKSGIKSDIESNTESEKQDNIEDAVAKKIDEFIHANNLLLTALPGHSNFIVYKTAIDNIVAVLKFLARDHELRFTILTDLFATDFPARVKRFEVVYSLLSLKLNRRILLKIEAGEQDQVPSVHKIFKAACWYEREIFDMFGISFSGYADLRRILTDYGFEGHPLRKDFPLTGYKQVKYDRELEKVVYEPVCLEQEFRDFDYLSPWQGPGGENNINSTSIGVLPGDEKATK